MVKCQMDGGRGPKGVGMTVYLVIMLVIIGGITVISVPSLFRRKCPQCGGKNHVEAKVCEHCGTAFPEDE
jgi:hypothetical protein